MDLDSILDTIYQKYPEGSRRFENELRSLKRNLGTDERLMCNICNRSFKHRATFNRHIDSHKKKLCCFLCQRKFERSDNLKRHEQGHLIGYKNFNGDLNCKECGMKHNDYTSLFNHMKSFHYSNQDGGNVANQSDHTKTTKEAFDKSVNVMKIFPSDLDRYDLLTFYSNTKHEIMDHLKKQCEQMKHLKWYINLHVEFMRETNNEERDFSQPYFKSKTYTLLSKDAMTDNTLNEAFQKQFTSFDEYIARGSGWTLNAVLHIEVHTVQYKPLGGSNYFDLPKSLKDSHSIINIQNSDEKCFLYAILAHIHPAKNNPQRVSNYISYQKELNMKDIKYPVQISDIPRFENQNNIAVNVIGYEANNFFPIHISKHRNKSIEIDLLYITRDGNEHYCYIKNLDRLLSRTTCLGTAYKFCRYCLQGFTSKKVLTKHLKYCSQYDAQHVEYPIKGNGDDIVEFDDFSKQLRVPFVVYCDFEALVRKKDTCLPSPSKSNTTVTADYEICGYGYQVVCVDDRYTKPPVIYRGSDASKHFLESLLQEEEYIREILDHIEPLHMTNEDEIAFQNSKQCFICGEEFSMISGKVRDHCHISGKYRGSACSNCNLNYKYPSYTPVYFHNLRSYDAHLIMQSIGQFKQRKISCIPNNFEKYVSFSLGSLRFLDSYQCLPNSLSGLVEDLVKEDSNHFKKLAQEFPTTEKRKLLLRKGVYPYTWMDNKDKFSVNVLPPKDAFYNDLTKSHISDEDYDHAKNVWEKFEIRHMGEYHDLYLKSDVLQLADVFERFRDECLSNYGLDPAHFFTCPGLAWSAALKISKCRLELITQDISDAYLFIESGLRGGVSQVSNRYAKANNKYLEDTYDPTEESSYLIYHDCNNLYGKAMQLPLPVSDFRFLNEDECKQFKVESVDINSTKGYILEVDLDYPKELHDLHSDYSLAPESNSVSDDMLSPYSKDLWSKLQKKESTISKAKTPQPGKKSTHSRAKTPKLLCTLYKKHNYVCHYRNLQLYLQLGMKIKKIHRILEFTQYSFLKEYVELNTKRRQEADGEFRKSFFKLMNNAVFGKTMENLRNRVDISLIHNKKRLLKRISRSSFERLEIFNEDLAAVQCKKTVLKLNKPLSVGMTILELAKCIMYDHHYNHVMKKYGNSAKLMMTDTDSLLYHIKTEDLYEDMKKDMHLYDFSNYPKDHKLYNTTNAKVPGLFKDETASKPIVEFVGLRSKMYSLKYDMVEHKRAKGIQKAVVKNDLKHEQYVNCVLEGKTVMCNMNLIRSKKHNLQIINVNKLGLSGFDDKRYILNSGIDTLAFGHYRIRQTMEVDSD